MAYPTPDREGHYWAKLKLAENPDDNSPDWEVVQVFENCLDRRNPEYLMASVPGISGGQRIDAFVWGPAVKRPPELT